MNISEILGNDFLSKFEVVHSHTLFPPNWDALKVDRCPICGNKLKFPYNKSIALCNGKKHNSRKNFVINLDRLKKIKETDYSKTYLPYKNM